MGVSRRSWLAGLLGLAAVATIAASPPQPAPLAQSGDVVVFAAASLKNALDAINTHWQKKPEKRPRFPTEPVRLSPSKSSRRRRHRCSSRPTLIGWTMSPSAT